MYDYVKTDFPLPIAGFMNRRFQTKNLSEWGGDLIHYRISDNGYLYETDRGDPDDQELWDLQDFTGEVQFCDFVSKDPETKSPLGWIEFSARFEHGKLMDHIELIQYDRPEGWKPEAEDLQRDFGVGQGEWKPPVERPEDLLPGQMGWHCLVGDDVYIHDGQMWLGYRFVLNLPNLYKRALTIIAHHTYCGDDASSLAQEVLDGKTELLEQAEEHLGLKGG